MFLILTVLIGLGILLGQLFKEYYTHAYDSRLSKEGELVTKYIAEEGSLDDLNQDILKKVGELLESRLTIVSIDEEILFDSVARGNDRETADGEMLQFILTQSKKKNEDVFQWDGNYYYYYKSPIMIDHVEQGYLILSTLLQEVEAAYKEIWQLLIICLGAASIIIIILVTRITTRYTKPIEAATEVAYELAKGNYRARTYEDTVVETAKLSTSINILARNLQAMVKANEIQQNRLTTLIENMGSGLLLIDEKGKISLTNRTFREWFRLRDEDCLHHFYYDVLEHKEISNLIEEIFMTEKKVKKTMLLPITIERRYFDVYGVPLLGSEEEWKGTLLVFHDITELKQLEQIRKDFVANVSHELKTPVTSIKGFAETLLEGAKNDKKVLDEFLQIIYKESDRLQSLIFDLLELSKIERHEFKLSITKVNVTALLEEILKVVEKNAEKKNIHIFFNKKSDIVIEGDEYRLEQVFINMITNGINYTPNGGSITVSIGEKSEIVEISIKDTGIGIAQDEIPRIFERFYRVDKARSRNSGGTGLGLAIVKHLIDAHRGKIEVNSVIGEGTEFIIQLPKKYKHPSF